MAPSDRMEEAEPLHTFDSINVLDFRDDSVWAHLHYTWVWIMFIGAILAFCGEIWTCTILLVYGPTWSTSSATLAIDVSVARWIFSASILLSCVLLALEFIKANKVVKSRCISSAVSNKVAGEFYRLQDYNYFCFIEAIRDSKKLRERLSFLVVSQLKGWKFLAIQTPRQIINIMTLLAFMAAIGFDIDRLDDIGQLFPELKNADVFTFSVMMFTLVMFICSVLATLAAMVLWILLSSKLQVSPKSFVSREMNKRIDTMVRKIVKQRASGIQFNQRGHARYPSDDADPGSGRTCSASRPQSRPGRSKPPRPKPTLPNIDVELANSGEDARTQSKARIAQQFCQQQQQQHLALELDHSSFQLPYLSLHYLQPDQHYQDPVSAYPSPALSSQQLLKQSSTTELSRSPIMHPSTMAAVTSPVLITTRHSMRREQPQLQFYQNGALSHQQVYGEDNQGYNDAYPRTPRFAPDYTLGESGLEKWRMQHEFPAGEGHECTSPTAQQSMGSCRPDSGVLPELTDPCYQPPASLESDGRSFFEYSQTEQDAAVGRTISAVYQPGRTEIEQYNSLFKGIAESHQRVKANRSKVVSRTHTRSYSVDPLGAINRTEQPHTVLASHISNDAAGHQERYLPTPESSISPSSRLTCTRDLASHDDPSCLCTMLDPPYATFMGSGVPSPVASKCSSATTSPCLSQRILTSRPVNPSYKHQSGSSPSLARVSTTPFRKLSDGSVSAMHVAMLLGNNSIGRSRDACTDGTCEMDHLNALRIDDMIEDLTASLQGTPRSSVASYSQAPPRTTSPLRASGPSSSFLIQGESLSSSANGDGPRTFPSVKAAMPDSEGTMSPLGVSLRTGHSLFEGQKRSKVNNRFSNDPDPRMDATRVEARNGASTDVSSPEHDSDDSEDEEEDEGPQVRQGTAHAKAQVYQQPKCSWTASTSTLMSMDQAGNRSSSPVFKHRAAGSSTTSLTAPATANLVTTVSRPTLYRVGPYSMSRTSLELESWGESSLSLAKKSIEMARASIDRPRTPMERSGLSVELSRR
ncbi:unnamed protein product [Mortierella alpina]